LTEPSGAAAVIQVTQTAKSIFNNGKEVQMTADLFLGSLTILTMAAIVIVSLTGTRDRNIDEKSRSSSTRKANEDHKTTR